VGGTLVILKFGPLEDEPHLQDVVVLALPLGHSQSIMAKGR